jgi:DUF917 family protein
VAYQLEQKDLEALLLGGCFFGSGGGGTVTSARHLAAAFVNGDYYPEAVVNIVSVDEAREGDAVMVAYMGAPEAIDSATYPLGPVQAAQEVQQRLAEGGRKLAYIVPPESGALGFVVACLVAARLGLAVIDADGAGRAVPSLPMLTFAAAEINPRPAMLVSQSGLSVELDVKPAPGAANGAAQHQTDVSVIVEQMLRPIVANPQFAQFGGLAMWIMTGDTLGTALPIRGTLSRALALGRALLSHDIPDADAMLGYLRQSAGLDAVVLFGPARITAVKVDTSGGFDTGSITLDNSQDSCTVTYQNESLLAQRAGEAQPAAMAPDSISWFVEGIQAVYSNGDLVMPDGSVNPAVKDANVTLIGIAAAAPLRVTNGLILDSFMNLLKTLGYNGPYLPLQATGQGSAA